jgi:hypothetical protein
MITARNTKRFHFPMQRRTLHPNEFCGSRDIARKPLYLRQKVIMLKTLAGIAQG